MAQVLADASSAVSTAVGKAAAAITPNPHKSWIKWEDAEQPVDGEEDKINQLIDITGRMQARNQAQHGKTFRVTHVKTIGVVKGTLTIKNNLPDYLQQGIFAQPGKSYDVAGRFANEPVHILPDTAKGPRGLGLKVFGVEGSPHSTQDLLFNNAPMLELTDLDTCIEIFALRERFWDDKEGYEAAIAERSDKVKQTAPTLLPNTPVISNIMFTQSAFRFGPYVAHLSLIPTDPSQNTLANKTQLSSDEQPDAQRTLLANHFSNNPATYTLRAQFSSSLDKQPVEDASVIWSEVTAPWYDLAEVKFEQGQDVLSEKRVAWWEDKIALSPWGGLEEHRPLGSINRLRKRVYEASRARRGEGNGQEVYFPKSVDEMPQ